MLDPRIDPQKHPKYDPRSDGPLRDRYPLYPARLTFRCPRCVQGQFAEYDVMGKMRPPNESPKCNCGAEMFLFSILFSVRRPQWWDKHNVDFDRFFCTVYGWLMGGRDPLHFEEKSNESWNFPDEARQAGLLDPAGLIDPEAYRKLLTPDEDEP